MEKTKVKAIVVSNRGNSKECIIVIVTIVLATVIAIAIVVVMIIAVGIVIAMVIVY